MYRSKSKSNVLPIALLSYIPLLYIFYYYRFIVRFPIGLDSFIIYIYNIFVRGDVVMIVFFWVNRFDGCYRV